MTIHRILTPMLLGLAWGVAGAQAYATQPVTLNIEAQPVRLALQQFGEQAGLQVLMRLKGDEADNVKISAVKGEFTAKEGLERLLAKTGLQYEFVNERTVRVAKAEDGEKKSSETMKPASEGDSPRNPETPAPGTGKDSSSTDSNKQTNNDNTSGNQRTTIQEVIVTAQKRAERIQDVPLSIAAITRDDIDRRGFVSGEDYLRGIPGVNYTSAAIDGSSIIIRGMETSLGAQNFSSGTTVATYFGEVPTTNSGGLSGGSNVDIKLVDIERVEVLRGPQGTAFGNSSLGGAVRTIPVAPNLHSFEAKVGAGYSVTSGRGSDNHVFQGVANLPLIEGKVALRASAYQFDDSGYYRNVGGSDPAYVAAAATTGAQAYAIDQNDVGASQFAGGRISALLQPTSDLKFTLMYLTQKTEMDGLAFANSATYDQQILAGAPEHVRRGQRAGLSDTDIDLANAVMEYNLGWANLLATYSHVKGGSTFISSFSWLPAYDYATPASDIGTSTHREQSGEVRLITQLEGAWNFLAGLYAEKLQDRGYWDFYWHGDPAEDFYAPGERYLGEYLDRRSLRQRAAFGEAVWKFLPRWTLTGGARTYRYDRSTRVDQAGPFFGTDTLVNDADASGTTYRVNLSYKPTEQALLYATWSQGFRLGKPQPGLIPGLCDVNGDGVVDGTTATIEDTRSTASDTVDNYELGGKFTLLDSRLVVTGDVYRIDWSDMPFRVGAPQPPEGCGLAYNANAGSARSEGVELQTNFYVSNAFRVDLGGSWIRARLTADAPAVGGFAGDRLPGSPSTNANLGLQYSFNLGRYKAYVRSDSTYVGSFNSALLHSPQAKAGGYLQLDASARVEIDQLNLDLYVRNLSDVDAFVNRMAGAGEFAGYRMRPRTVGLQASYNF